MLLDKPVTIEVVFEDHKFLRNLGVLRRSKSWTVQPTRLGAFMDICKVLLRISLTQEEMERSTLEMALKYGALHGEDLLDALAIAIHNKEGKPPRRIKRILRRNVNNAQLLGLLKTVIGLLNVNPFTTSIILISGMSLLKRPEIIAGPVPGDLPPE